MNYVEIGLIQQELKERNICLKDCSGESHYAEVVCNNKSPTTTKSPPIPDAPEETLYRLSQDHRIEKPKIHAKVGDIFLSKTGEKGGQVVGDLIQVAPKNNYHVKVSIPVDKLTAYSPTAKRSIPPHTPSQGTPTLKSNTGYIDMSDMKLANNELEILCSYFPELSEPGSEKILQEPPMPSPCLEKGKLLQKDKFGKLMTERKRYENEVLAFAICDRKTSPKERGVIAFKRKQMGTLIFASSTRWWLVKVVEGSKCIIGWVPGDYWRIMPENIEDDYINANYLPWLLISKEVTQCEQSLSISGNDKNFLFIHDKQDEVYTLLLKRGNEVLSFRVNILPNKTLVFTGRYFQTLHNLVIYFKRNPISANDPNSTLGLPFALDT